MEEKKIYFIFGHLDLTEKEFDEYYKPKIDDALKDRQSHFIVCDAKGADYLAQKYLELLGIEKHRVLIYHMYDKPRFETFYPTRGGFTSDKERDCSATVDSTHDIAWVKKGREKSGTAKSLMRRKKKIS